MTRSAGVDPVVQRNLVHRVTTMTRQLHLWFSRHLKFSDVVNGSLRVVAPLASTDPATQGTGHILLHH
jgi:hypothetical protein